MIRTQAEGHSEVHEPDTSDLYVEDVQIIAKAGKAYYYSPSVNLEDKEAAL